MKRRQTTLQGVRFFGRIARDVWRLSELIDDSRTPVRLLCDSLLLAASLSTGRYHGIVSHLSNDEKLVLYLLTLKLKRPTVAVEIGSFLGASACFLALGLSRKGRLYCVDTWNNDAMDQPQRDTFDEFMQNARNFRKEIVPLRGTSADISKKFDLKIDFLFVDGDHSYDACLEDWLSWRRLLVPNAVVVFHDVGWAEGVIKVVAEYVAPVARREVKMNNMYIAWL